MKEIYLDNNATTKPLPKVVEATMRAMETYGNPSSPHRRGDITRRALQEARQKVANLVGCGAEGIIFTSGGTEANNLILQSCCDQGKRARLITTAVEHSSVLNTASVLKERGVRVEILEVDRKGRVDPDQLADALAKPASLVSIQWANSETGTLQQIEKLGKICRSRQVQFHVDAAQAVGRLPIDLRLLPVEFLSFTAHKIHGPQGVGAIAANLTQDLKPIFQGGDQEAGLRPGTENLAGIAGFGQAAQLRLLAMPSCIEKMRHMRDTFEQHVLNNLLGTQVNGDLNNRVANSTNILFPGIDGMAMMAQLDNKGVCCSLTSACISARPEPSHVLRAMGCSEDHAYSSLRFSFSLLNTEEEVRLAASKVCEIYGRLAGLEQLSGRQT